MNTVFDKFIKEINFVKTPGFKDVSVTRAKLVGDIFELNFSSQEIIPFNEMESFLQALNTNFKYKTRFDFIPLSVTYDVYQVKQYLSWILTNYLQKPNFGLMIKNSEIEINQHGEGVIKVTSKSVEKEFHTLKPDVERIMKRFGFKTFSINMQLDDKFHILDDEKNQLLNEADKALKAAINSEEKPKNDYKKSSNERVVIKISELKESNLVNVNIEGEIFDLKIMETKSGYLIYTYSLTDYSDAVYVKAFVRKEDTKKHHNFNVGEYVSVFGTYQIDSYTKEPTIISKGMKKIFNKDDARIDNAPEKRIELNARTRMSTMDGIVSAKQIVNRAKAWGHKSIAIVDTESVQSFPEFYHATKGTGIKPIYGVTVNAINKNPGAIFNAQSKELSNQDYVVFDLETTGLSATYDDIIEFGAVKIRDGQVLERKQFFVKPTKPIPPFITEITNIRNEDVVDAKPESEAIKDIRDYLADATLVAHNAQFDINFVNEKLDKYGFEQISNPVIDTMIVARMVDQKAKRFRLENVATRYGVVYDSTVAHRADYDADILAKVWLRMIDNLKDMQINTQHELRGFRAEYVNEKAFSKEVTLIAKNQEGLKELFEIVSQSLTDNLYKRATVFYEDLATRQNVLMGSGALRSKLVDYMLTGSRQQVIDEISKYDYIEIQPLQNFAHKINDSISKEDLESSMRFVVQEAKKQGKLVVATGDVRYLDPRQKLYHEVYINAKGLGGIRHYLFRYNQKNPVYPDQHMLTTDEMLKAFAFIGDIHLVKEVVIKNPNLIADQIEEIQVIKDKLYTPKFGNSDEELEKIVYAKAHEMYGNLLPKIVDDRIKKELTPIKKYGFAVIYYISHLLVGKSLKDGYLVGSRGSVGSSLVATMAEITEVNPLAPHYLCCECKYSEFDEESHLNSGYDLPDKKCPKCGHNLDKEGQNIPFETFLGFDADKVPDIDLNFSGEYQPIIHAEVKRLFGDKHSFRAGTISTVAEKTAFGYVRAWAEGTERTISRAFTEFIAKGVAGTKRTTGQHPGGIIVIPQEYDVEDFTPINFPANDKKSSWKTTHFDFHAIHDNVLKLDLLGHDDPTAIKYLEKLTGINVKKDIPFSDPNIIELFSSPRPLGIKPEDIDGESTGAMGIPEFGTNFVRRMLKAAKVTSFGDLISISGLSHGTDVWSGNAELIIKELNKELSDVISCRDNIMTDLMAKKLDPLKSFNIMEKVRKGKGLTEDEEKLLRENNVEEWYIESLKKIKYMFPKAHATAYVMMAWRIAWFKLYHPEAYYATYFTTRADVFDISTVVQGPEATLKRLKELKAGRNKRGADALTNKEVDLIPIMELATEAFARGINIANIDLNKSQAKNWIIDDETNALIPPFISLDGLGESVALSIIEARKEGSFISVEDLQKRSSLNKTTIEKLKSMGVLSHLSESNQVSLFDNLF